MNALISHVLRMWLLNGFVDFFRFLFDLTPALQLIK